MKTRTPFFCLLLSLTAGSAVAQNTESDDMYFNSKDRAKLRAERQRELTYASTSDYHGSTSSTTYNTSSQQEDPTVTYSGRNTNPEYVARQNSQTTMADEQNYYSANYRYGATAYAQANNYNNWNNSYNNWYSGSWYNPSWYGPMMYSRMGGMYGYSPYSYGNGYNGYGYDPYGYGSYYGGYGNYGYGYGSGWNLGLSLSYGYPYGGWSYGFYPSYGYGWGSSYWGMGMGYGYGGYYGWGSSVVVVNNYSGTGGRNVVYGSRGGRGVSSGSNYYANNRSDVARDHTRGLYSQYNNPTTNTNTSSRVATATRSTQQDAYYNRSWRSAQSGNTLNNTGNTQRSFFNNSGSGQSRSYTPSNSGSGWGGGGRSFGGGGGGGRSFGGGGGGGFGGGGHSGGGGGGHSRGR